ncbi:mitochondrial ribosomal protein S10 [Suhomyces tanzawaensis NRRL Y-17324]|uniref:Mitochondrial ribosomal protein S10 n=1 Tax=Suhomyces tanzawaensis NRRL Y-17324 TaxID=984487 RepID=A0A1E4SIS3_9ASCO|nr:mitochondrial ribosomal protein S10 [Suhomyces tanzawaensis NRRL Y-17324]ODV79401.1 mitochondrial ribosomal protein S10 [Suhomyces tanzawaensis NRRL Y-17324]
METNHGLVSSPSRAALHMIQWSIKKFFAEHSTPTMLPSIYRRSPAYIKRGLTTSTATLQNIAKGSQKSKKFLTPEELTQAKQSEQVEEAIYQEGLLNGEFKYVPRYLSANKVDPVTSRPVPINVELLKYKPITLPQTHGHQVAKLDLKGYDEDNLIRASEFAARAAYYLGIPTSKVTTKKTEKRLYTVIKSPFAQAKTKQNFHRVTYHREIVAYDANPEVVDLWLSLINKHALRDVDYKGTVTTYEALDFNQQLDQLTEKEVKLPEAYDDVNDPIAAKVQELLKSDTFKKFLKE